MICGNICSIFLALGREGTGMGTARYAEIDEIITYIGKHLDEPLPLNRLAAHVAYSPYHFARIFKERMGLPPLYYVSSLRLQRAKELLLNTNYSIRDIGLEIGQQSLGTFTTRFTERVGVTPAEFRTQPLHADHHLQALKRLADWRTVSTAVPQYATVRGTIQAEVPFEGVILIGLFARPIPEGMPLYGTLISSLGDFSITGVKPGTYYLMATSIAWEMQAKDVLLPQATLRTRSKKPIVIGSQPYPPHLEAMLHPPHPEDPPILISLPLLMNSFLQRTVQHSHR